ncbi:MAG: hypothetical protein QOK02_2264, partial [Mycobacterium sp.]|nr:hypothetical protein [Mycobacterium sp.]
MATTGNTHIQVVPVDLADWASVASFVATNHLGHFALATSMHRALAAAGGARIVSVSSRAP